MKYMNQIVLRISIVIVSLYSVSILAALQEDYDKFISGLKQFVPKEQPKQVVQSAEVKKEPLADAQAGQQAPISSTLPSDIAKPQLTDEQKKVTDEAKAAADAKAIAVAKELAVKQKKYFDDFLTKYKDELHDPRVYDVQEMLAQVYIKDKDLEAARKLLEPIAHHNEDLLSQYLPLVDAPIRQVLEKYFRQAVNKKAATPGNLYLIRLADMYEKGWGGDKNFKKAREVSDALIP